MKQLLTPIRLGSMELRNRVVMAPTSMMLSLEEKIDFLGQVADGGAALIYVGDMGVEPGMPAKDLSLLTPEGLDNCRRLLGRLHQGGARGGAQLYLWDYDPAGLMELYRTGATREEIRAYKDDRLGEYVDTLPQERIQEIVDHFADAAQAAQEAGFDMVQILGGHLLNSFSSGYLNHRRDAYGGSVENRARLACQVAEAVRRRVGKDFPIEYKLAVHDDAIPCGQGGPDIREIGVFVTALEKAGVDAFQAALSNRSVIEDTVPPRNHKVFSEEGCFLYVSDEIKKHTSLPVSCAGKLSSPDFCEELIASGRLDYIAMSRQLVADPQWVTKVAQNRESEIRRCIFCNKGCLGSLLTRQKFHCVLDNAH